MKKRELKDIIESVPASDGAGVRLRRSLGRDRNLRIDPFLLLDEFSSDNPDDYVAGFPSHPHRGFETVTYMLDGRMRHQDSVGNRGDLGPGDVQWMTAARGIIHSEMPQQTAGRMRGLQLWINLPAREKMQRPSWRDVPAREIPMAALEGGGQARVIAGSLVQTDAVTAGPIRGASTDPLYFDVWLPPHASVRIPVALTHNAFLYAYEGEASVGDQARIVPRHAAGFLSPGDVVQIGAGESGARLLVIAGRPIGEPVVQYGPFVMNTREEIERAIADYQAGRLVSS